MKFLIALLFVSSSVFAANSASLALKGTVVDSCSVSLVETADTSSLDIINGEVGVKVATVTEICNRAAGYQILLSSTNGSKLMMGTNAIPYTIAYFNTTYKTITSVPIMMKNVASLTAKTTATSDVLINITAHPDVLSGVYTDTITITIQGN